MNPKQRARMEKYQLIAGFLKEDGITNSLTVLDLKQIVHNEGKKLWKHAKWFPEIN